MALYRYELKIYGRRTGGNAVSAAAYRSGARGYNGGKGETRSALGLAAYRACSVLRDERSGETFDYSRKQHVEWSSVLAPQGAPSWVQDRQALWNAVEAREKRPDAQLCREALLSLPRELTREQRIALVRAFVHDAFVVHGMVADIAIHNPPASDGGEQPHAHVLLTMRDLDPDGPQGFGLKRRDWNGVDWQTNTARHGKDAFLHARRPMWAEYVNAALADAEETARVDHRSLKARGIDRRPQPKLGKARHAKPGPEWVEGKSVQLHDVAAHNGHAAGTRRVGQQVRLSGEKLARQLTGLGAPGHGRRHSPAHRHGPELATVSQIQEPLRIVVHVPYQQRAPDIRDLYGYRPEEPGYER